LGLVTVKRLTDLYHGNLHLHSTPGQGTRVEIALPACDPPSPASAPVVRESLQVTGCRILLVDDEQIVRRPLARLLKNMGCEVTEAGGGREALALLQNPAMRFDVVLSDVDMPDMSGLALAEALKQISAPPVLVLMSGYGPEAVYSAEDSPAQFWLQKPFGPDVLRKTLQDAKRFHQFRAESGAPQ
jgi:CheY-like chemotaxis protein